VIIHGSQQGLSLLAQVLLDAGDVVVVEEPAYTGALQVFRTAQARLVPVQLDEDGMDTDALEAKLAAGLRPKVVHTVSNFHNPRGAVLSAQRRAHLAALADRYGFWVLEDDPYGELYFGEKPPAPLAALSDRVIRLSSASKVLAPALRVGWLHERSARRSN
jgi:2-aminoadipate transaminase